MKLPDLFICEKCGQIVLRVKNTKVPIICCGQPMTKIEAGTVDAALEKHVPVVSQEGNVVSVKVGEVEHPSLEEHYIEWILISTENGIQKKALKPGDTPVAKFVLLDDDKLIETYAYCNLHGLWKA